MTSPSIRFTWLNGPDIARLAMTDDEILAAVEGGLLAQGEGRTVIEPRMHLTPDPAFRGHFNVLRGYVAPLDLAGVKIVGDYVDNWQKGLPSEMALLNLFDPRTGMPVAILDATAITEMRTGALTALGARQLARKDSRILGHVGARGTAYWNIRLLDRLFDFAEIRVHSRRKESREAFARTLEQDLGKKIVVTTDWQSCLEGADIMVEASRLDERQEMFKTAWIKKGACVIPYRATQHRDRTELARSRSRFHRPSQRLRSPVYASLRGEIQRPTPECAGGVAPIAQPCFALGGRRCPHVHRSLPVA